MNSKSICNSPIDKVTIFYHVIPKYFNKSEKNRAFQTSNINRGERVSLFSSGQMKSEEILDLSLMFRCLHWGDSVCQRDIKDFIDAKETAGPGDNTRRLPTFDELKRLNGICKNCPGAMFEIYERTCPSCGNIQIVADCFAGDHLIDFRVPQLCYLYKCPDCGKPLFSGRQL